MRDLREDLRQRLRSFAMEKGTLKERIAWIERVEEQTRGLLEYEEMRVRSENQDQNMLFPDLEASEGERSVLSQFLRDVLMDGREHSLDGLKRAAQERGIDFGDKNPGRVLHFALLGMAQSGVVQMVDKGVWRIPQPQ